MLITLYWPSRLPVKAFIFFCIWFGCKEKNIKFKTWKNYLWSVWFFDHSCSATEQNKSFNNVSQIQCIRITAERNIWNDDPPPEQDTYSRGPEGKSLDGKLGVIRGVDMWNEDKKSSFNSENETFSTFNIFCEKKAQIKPT